MTWDGSSARVRPVNQHLWKKFVHIAQPYFYPLVRGGGWITLLLMGLLLGWVFALLLLCVAALTLAGHHLNPTLTDTIASGLAARDRQSGAALRRFSGGWAPYPRALATVGVARYRALPVDCGHRD